MPYDRTDRVGALSLFVISVSLPFPSRQRQPRRQPAAKETAMDQFDRCTTFIFAYCHLTVSVPTGSRQPDGISCLRFGGFYLPYWT